MIKQSPTGRNRYSITPTSIIHALVDLQRSHQAGQLLGHAFPVTSSQTGWSQNQ